MEVICSKLNNLLSLRIGNDVKGQVLITLTTVFLELSVIQTKPRTIEVFMEYLLDVVSKTNKSVDRNLRSIAAECLSEMELAYPLLLSENMVLISNLAEQEITHSFESLMSLSSIIIKQIVNHNSLLYKEEQDPKKKNSNDFVTKTFSSQKKRLIPFNVPLEFLYQPQTLPSLLYPSKDSAFISQGSTKEILRVLSLIMDDLFSFTKFGQFDLIFDLLFFFQMIDLPKQLIKTHYSKHLYLNSPFLFHSLLYLKKSIPNLFENIDDETLCDLLMSFINDDKMYFFIFYLHFIYILFYFLFLFYFIFYFYFLFVFYSF